MEGEETTAPILVKSKVLILWYGVLQPSKHSIKITQKLRNTVRRSYAVRPLLSTPLRHGSNYVCHILANRGPQNGVLCMTLVKSLSRCDALRYGIHGKVPMWRVSEAGMRRR